MATPILKKTTTTKTDRGDSVNTVYILPFRINTEHVRPESVEFPNDPNISCDYKCYLSIANISNKNIAPFKLWDSSDERLVNISEWPITLPISSDDYMEEFRKAFVSKLGCLDADIVIELF